MDPPYGGSVVRTATTASNKPRQRGNDFACDYIPLFHLPPRLYRYIVRCPLPSPSQRGVFVCFMRTPRVIGFVAGSTADERVVYPSGDGIVVCCQGVTSELV